jgi:hypothetical protein
MRSRIVSFLLAGLLVLELAVPALEAEGGEGVYGKTDDKVITNFGFGLIVFFTLLVVGLSTVQHLLEKRKSK